MNVRIGVAESSKVVEVEVEDLDSFKKDVESAVSGGSIAWFTDTKGREVGIPAQKIAFVEVETENGSRSVGFAPAV